jgi:hypothetical protein
MIYFLNSFSEELGCGAALLPLRACLRLVNPPDSGPWMQ